MKTYRKTDFPVADARKFLEPAPTVLVSSAWDNRTNIMAMGWYSILEFTPSLVGCMISSGNYSFDLIKKSGECVINIPTLDLAKTTVGIGNCSGADVDKFDQFGLTSQKATLIDAPLIKECYANFECRIYDRKLIGTYNFFIMEIVKAHVSVSPEYPDTFHYRGDSTFMVSGKNIHIPSEK